MSPEGLEPTIPTSERPQTHASDRAVTGIGMTFNYSYIFSLRQYHCSCSRSKTCRNVPEHFHCRFVVTGQRTVVYAGLMGKPQGKRRLGNMGVNGRIILKRIFKEYKGVVDWIVLAHGREEWWALFKPVLNA